MSHNTISTGRSHQRDVAVWVRRRVSDSRGRSFDDGRGAVEQHGAVLADAVGLGKTWEALAASALILVEMGKRKSTGGLRKNTRRRMARVLVLCPPGLVAKWSREIRDPSGFSHHLGRWARRRDGRSFVVDTLTTPFEIRRKTDVEKGAVRGSRVQLAPGTYVCNWNVVRKRVRSGRSRLATLRSQDWDVIIVDEAHHREARDALKTVTTWSQETPATLLLTATPFQLEPMEIHRLLRSIVDGSTKAHCIFSRPPTKPYVDALKRFFDGGSEPNSKLKLEAQKVLRQLIARSNLRSGGRRYFLIGTKGESTPIAAPQRMRERDLKALCPTMIGSEQRFESWYFQQRLALCDIERTFIPTKLRQYLSTRAQAQAALGRRGGAAPKSPRLSALIAWAAGQIRQDLLSTAADGHPRKLLLFTSFVGEAALELKEAMAEAFSGAIAAVRRKRYWQQLSSTAVRGVESVATSIERYIHNRPQLNQASPCLQIPERIREMPTKDAVWPFELFGHQRYRRLVIENITQRLEMYAATQDSDSMDRWGKRLHREERQRARRMLAAISISQPVETYTGHDDQRERDVAGEAFRSPMAPWALVASNVGSEGIDLHTFSARLVHFDIEWNPAKMEQREGRADRIGRRLKEPVDVYLVLVRGTYDERMLHQLVARQRWHSVLLGRPAAKLSKDRDGQIEARVIDPHAAQKLALDLRPPRAR